MEDETQVIDPQQNDIPKLIPATVEFTVPGDPEDGVADKTYTIGRFTFAKTLLMMQYLGELAERVDVASIFVQRNENTVIGIDAIVEKVPVLLRTMRPTVVRLLALTLMKNKEVENVIENEESIDAALIPYRKEVYRLETQQATELLKIAIERMGISDIRKSFPLLLAAMSN
jgi:hypothetical protein